MSHLFNTPHTVVTYFENTSKTLIDGELDGHTHFDGIFIKSMTMSDSRVPPSPIHHTEGEIYIDTTTSDKQGMDTYRRNESVNTDSVISKNAFSQTQT